MYNGGETTIDDVIDFARFKQQLLVRVSRARLGIHLRQDEVLVLLADDEETRTFYEEWRSAQDS